MPALIIILDAGGSDDLASARVARRDGEGPIGDRIVDEAFNALEVIRRYYAEVHYRDSLDDAGFPLRAVVNYGESIPQAWMNEGTFILGDGGNLFCPFSICPNVLYVLASRKMIDFENPFHSRSGNLSGDAASIHIALADVFGCLIDQFARRQTVQQASWLIGENLFRPEIGAQALRSLAAPGKAYNSSALGRDFQVGHMREYLRPTRGLGYVLRGLIGRGHFLRERLGAHEDDPTCNAGIPAHALYRFSMLRDGYAWNHTGKLLYEFLTDSSSQPGRVSFTSFAHSCCRIAAELFGQDGEIDMRSAWREVGVLS